MARLINKSQEWGASVELLGDVGSGSWTLLAEAVKKGGGCIDSIFTSKEVIMRGKEEDLLVIWRVTQEATWSPDLTWTVDGDILPKHLQGWRKVQKMRQSSF